MIVKRLKAIMDDDTYDFLDDFDSSQKTELSDLKRIFSMITKDNPDLEEITPEIVSKVLEREKYIWLRSFNRYAKSFICS